VFVSNRFRIAQLAGEGLTASEIARRLELASPTVDYHLGRLVATAARAAALEPPTAAAQSQVGTRAEVERLLGLGFSRLAIARELGVAKSTVGYHARRLGEPVDERGARRYDWREIQRRHDNRLANLRMLCPNCHAPTDSWGGRNRGPAAVLTRIDHS